MFILRDLPCTKMTVFVLVRTCGFVAIFGEYSYVEPLYRNSNAAFEPLSEGLENPSG